jgi:hypothetical protein
MSSHDFSIGITVKGVKGAQSALKQFPLELGDSVINFLEDIGQPVHDEQVLLCPVDTGYLVSTLDYNVSGEGELTFEATAEYAGDVEYGTTRMAAQPYFNPPLDRLASSGIGDEFGRDALSNWDRLVSQYKNT